VYNGWVYEKVCLDELSNLPLLLIANFLINGDSDDYRVKDGNGVIIGLKFKKIANKVAEKYVLNSCFVVQPNDPNCSYEQINVSVLQTIK